MTKKEKKKEKIPLKITGGIKKTTEKEKKRDYSLLSENQISLLVGYSIKINPQDLFNDLLQLTLSFSQERNTIPLPWANNQRAVCPFDPYSFIYGCILGDAYINQYGAITINHGYKEKTYTIWKFLILKKYQILTNRSSVKLVVNYNKKRKKYYTSYRFNTLTLFSKERDLFYIKQGEEEGVEKRRKRLPLSFPEDLNPLILAIWFMDDGGLGGNTANGLVIDLSGFTPNEHIIIQKVLYDKFHLLTSLHKHNREKNHVKLFFKKETVGRFVEIIKPYIIPSMLYKIKI